ncbi:MAG: pantoate--beta-alanine ligase [Alphaproteobacteria bacterium]|nr:pantoate--beta-alanine ligase [Alphaproteobacteria bacterium]
MTISILKTKDALQAQISQWRGDGLQLGLVPTMGALHDGHLALVEQIAPHVDQTIVAIFVNPRQFAEGEDFDIYPRQLDEDANKIAAQAAKTPNHAKPVIYAPDIIDIYPPNFATYLRMEGAALGLESDTRPHFFDGMALFVLKLFLQCQPDVTIFGEKDYQQLLVVRRMIADLDLPIKLIAAPTVREADGLALSSRNVRLSPAQRKIASQLNLVLAELAKGASHIVQAGRTAHVDQAAQVDRELAEIVDVEFAEIANMEFAEIVDTAFAEIEADGKSALLAAGFERVDYLAVRDAQTLLPPSVNSKALRVLAAAHLGTVRLIDNLPVILSDSDK